jgi:hypothetical protein
VGPGERLFRAGRLLGQAPLVYGHALIPGTALLPDLPPVDVVLYYARQTRIGDLLAQRFAETPPRSA